MEKQGRPVIASQFGTGRVLTDAMTIRRHSVGKDPACSELAGDYWSSLFFH
ncbi:hypothetical protein [Oenococcus oeni]|uniref:hypothetical protein n=1 Tax=Oenococcus oeni TaxID=1247 RepID=UPI00214CC032|nr:hypothetical protein [Oenococcus oeni]